MVVIAEITDEIMALRDFVSDLGFTKINLAHLPAKYVAGELSIRYIAGGTESETAYHYVLDRDYQFVVFGTSERDCLVKSSALQRRMNSAHKIKIGNAEESGYMTLGSFSCSQPFKAEDSEVYGVICVLQAQVREARDFSAYEAPKMGGITVVVKPKPPGSEDGPTKPDAETDRGIPGINDDKSDTDGGKLPVEYPEKEYEITEGNGACN